MCACVKYKLCVWACFFLFCGQYHCCESNPSLPKSSYILKCSLERKLRWKPNKADPFLSNYTYTHTSQTWSPLNENRWGEGGRQLCRWRAGEGGSKSLWMYERASSITFGFNQISDVFLAPIYKTDGPNTVQFFCKKAVQSKDIALFYFPGRWSLL